MTVDTRCIVILLVYFIDPLNPPTLTAKSTSKVKVICSIYRMNSETGPLIVGYEVFRFGVPMIGEYVNVGSLRNNRTVTISLAVPGAQYRITAWALSDYGRRSAAPAVKNVETTEVGKLTNALVWMHLVLNMNILNIL